MRVLTCLVFALTLLTGWLSYSGNGSVAEFLKLAYAYLALMSVVCAMIMLTMRPKLTRSLATRQPETASTQTIE